MYTLFCVLAGMCLNGALRDFRCQNTQGGYIHMCFFLMWVMLAILFS